VLVIAALIVLTFTACGQSAAGSSPRGRTDATSGAADAPHPPVAISQGPGPDATLPRVSASGATVQALWQLPLVHPEIVGDTVVGRAGDGSAARIEAVSALTGQLRWSVPAPGPDVPGVSVEGSAVIVEVGGELDDPAGNIAVKGIAVYSLADGRPLWHAPVAARDLSYLPGSRITHAAGTIVLADPDGELVARRATTGAVVWRASRPRSCPYSDAEGFVADARLGADGGLLVVSYHCQGSGRAHVLVERLSPASGRVVWRWRSVSVEARTNIDLAVVGAASVGEVVLLWGQGGSRDRYVRTFPNARRWPTALGPEGDEMLLALDARNGRPRWSEMGGQSPELAFTDGDVCEFDIQGVECREDSNGRASRPLLRTGLSERESEGPIFGEETAGVASGLVAVALKSRHGEPLAVEVAPVRGGGKPAQVLVQLGPGLGERANATPFIMRAGALPGGETLLLLRRLDVPETPLLALRVRPTRKG
jgi:outer membrane protein assembly factor BamB